MKIIDYFTQNHPQILKAFGEHFSSFSLDAPCHPHRCSAQYFDHR